MVKPSCLRGAHMLKDKYSEAVRMGQMCLYVFIWDSVFAMTRPDLVRLVPEERVGVYTSWLHALL